MTANTANVTDATCEDDVLPADRPVVVDAVPSNAGTWAAHAVLSAPGGAS